MAVLALGRCPGGERRRRLHLLEAAAAFLFCFAGCFAVRLAIVGAHFGLDMTQRFFDLRAFRMSGDARTLLDPALGHLFAERSVSASGVVGGLFDHLGVVGWGSRRLGLGMVVVAAGLLGVLTGRWLRAGAKEVARWGALLLSAAAVPLWYLLFPQHTAAHRDMMARLLVWPMAVAAAWLAALLVEPSPLSAQSPPRANQAA